MEIVNKRVLVIGLGLSGISTIKTLSSLEADVYGYDDKDESELQNVFEKLEKFNYKFIKNYKDYYFDFIVKSPGIKPTNEIIEYFYNKKVPIYTDLELAYTLFPERKIIAITGSNGKTTTKDIITGLLETKFKVHKTQGNFNNELGVPITILAAPEDSEILVLEMGADGFGQLDFLSKLVEPDYTVITNIGESHIEFFGSREGIAKAKFEITNGMKKDGFFVYNGDEVLLKDLVDKSNIGATSCGENDYNNIILENYTITRDHIDFKLNLSDEKFTTKLKGKHNLFNIMFATAIAEKLGLSIDEIRKAIEKTSEITHMRLESIPYGKDSLIINDAYNASPTSMKASVDVVSGFDDFDYKTLVLGSMFELGSKEVQYHSEVGEYISNNSKDIDLVISVGDLAKNITDNITNSEIKKLHFSSNEEVSNYLKENKHANEVILFKASRSMKLESIIEEINK